MQLTVIAAILVAAAGVVFALQNLTTVNVNLFWWSGESSLAVVLLLSVALGAVLIALISGMGFTVPVVALDSALPGGAMTEAARLGLALSLLAGPLALILGRLLKR